MTKDEYFTALYSRFKHDRQKAVLVRFINQLIEGKDENELHDLFDRGRTLETLKDDLTAIITKLDESLALAANISEEEKTAIYYAVHKRFDDVIGENPYKERMQEITLLDI